MARKLTEQERQEIEAMRAVLNDALPPAQRGIASGIASSLVRTPTDKISDEDLARITGKYEEADASVAQVVKDTLLDVVEGEEGTYVLRSPEQGETAVEEPEGPRAEDDQSESVKGEASVDEATPADVAGVASEAVAGELGEDGAPVEGAAADGATMEPNEASSTEDTAPQGEVAEGAGAKAPAVEEAPAPKPKRTRRGARRTHRTASSVKASADGAVQQKEGASASGASASEKPKEEKPKSDKEAKKGGAKADKEEKGSEGKSTDKDSKETLADKTAQDKGRRRESAPSRDLKKVPYVRRGGETEAEIRQRILELDQRFWVNGWLLSHPSAYTLYERELVAINDALSDGMLPGDITRRQLAYQMGGDEKFFEYGSDGFKLLRALGMEDVIRHRPMPKPDLVYYAPRRRKHMRVLVTENLDPYLDVHDLMYEDGRTSILGQRIHAVVLGGGTPILEKNRLALLLDTLGADTITVLYWGDIDRAGLEIMVKLKDVLGDGYKFRAFTPAYQLMVDKAMERFPDPADNESTGQVNIEPMDASLLVKGLTDEAATYAKAVIDDCGLIPQEILTRRDL